MDKLRIGVIGLGFGQHHVQTLANMSNVQLVAIANRPGGSAQDINTYAAKYGARAYSDGLDMLKHEPLDAVSICVSPRHRETLIRDAAQRNIALFVEKPWAATVEQAEHLAAICRQYNALVMVGFSFRFHPVIVHLRKLLDQELGAPWALSGDYVFGWLPDPAHWLWDPDNGGGFFNENSCHLLDSICYLMGTPTSVFAEAQTFRNSPSPEIATLTLRFESGAVASVLMGCLGAEAMHDYPRINLITEHGQAQLWGQNHTWASLTYAHRGDSAIHRIDEPAEGLGVTRYTAAFQHFLECVRTRSEPSATIEDGILAVKVAAAVYESARSRKPVNIR